MEHREEWRKAGRITAEAREYGRSLIKNGASALTVAEKVEEKIRSLGAEPAFPVQISLDAVAAHVTPDPDDPLIFDNNLVKLDVGVHADGYIGDTACTVDLSGNYAPLVKAAEDALAAAIQAVKEGKAIGEVGKAIHHTITAAGFAPIRNLSGHGLSQYVVHDKPTIPNYDTGDSTKLHDQVIAIEPFATTGRGQIFESSSANIFSLIQAKPVRNPFTRQVLKELEQYRGLPFTTRWLTKKFPLFKVNMALKDLKQLKIIREYPPLPEIGKGMVAQAEHSLLIGEEVEVLTLSR